MTDISDLAGLTFEDLAQADLFDLVRRGGASSSPGSPAGSEVGESSRSSSPSCLDVQESYTHITLINGEQICLRDEEDDWSGRGEAGGMDGGDSMDLNSILQAGVVERVASPGASWSQPDLHLLDWRPGETALHLHRSAPAPRPDTRPTLASRPRATILASQLPLPVPSNSRLLDRRPAVIISSSSLQLPADSLNNNNSLLRSALQGKAGQLLVAGERRLKGPEGEEKVEDILLLSLETCEAVARLKDGASQLFPNTRVTSEPNKEAAASSVISIEVDGSGNLVVHKGPQASPRPGPALSPGPSLSPRQPSAAHLAKVRKYHRRSKEEPKKESRLLHYCHICNKGFKDKYSVNVHVRTHTGEKPFSCQLCGKCFRQKAHLAKHQQTHASKQAGSSGEGTVQMATDDENGAA
jgi:hypothetical protein